MDRRQESTRQVAPQQSNQRIDTIVRFITGAPHWWIWLFIGAIVVSVVLTLLDAKPWDTWAEITAVVSFVLLIISMTRLGPKADDVPPRSIQSPVRGRWVALNSPATKVPSHVRYLGQAFAIDMVHPVATPLAPGWNLKQKRADEFSCFAEPIHAVADGTVVRTYNSRRDHRARNTWPGLIYMFAVEGNLRQLAGPNFITGNYIIVDHGDGSFAQYCHIQRDSIQVRPGQAISAGQVIGRVGNSGNSSEPHLHFQLMDRAQPTLAAGLPFRWDNITIEEGLDKRMGDTTPPADNVPGVPATGQIFTA